MGNYFDNQMNYNGWSWEISEKGAYVTTNHPDHGDGKGPHSHTLDLNNVTVGDMLDNSGKTMGDAHRAAEHDYEKGAEFQAMLDARDDMAATAVAENTTTASMETTAAPAEAPTGALASDPGGEDLDGDGLDGDGMDGGIE